MRPPPTCPRCSGELHAPGLWSSAWVCARHGEVHPLQPVSRPSAEGLRGTRHAAGVPLWLPWPLPDRWLVTGFARAGDERSGARACALALSGPAPLGGPADMVLVAEEPGVGLGARYAGLVGPDPGEGFGRGLPYAKMYAHGHPVPLWSVQAGADRAAFAGEALACWLWVVLWPAHAGLLLLEYLELLDLRDAGHLDIPYGALSPRIEP